MSRPSIVKAEAGLFRLRHEATLTRIAPPLASTPSRREPGAEGDRRHEGYPVPRERVDERAAALLPLEVHRSASSAGADERRPGLAFILALPEALALVDLLLGPGQDELGLGPGALK